ncbi:dynactin Arp1 p62 subunit RO2, putative [Talaromyces stipitatus ATCC 10500]|uniref:Dynactin subunit 4 n=1 Tax=Talaromyces stipitatus (strain ATCC 10500 / CBS 375.48 / QM 6759 / NRRL 1006) TaxID=441959 RepID=B8M800_TALSN|nr:dynactin Arp1 p62 subunit RO2, putative [Talaromyces stipitatus ATCC 10500]EED19962.1 dynactin Arp1 p62 subunit RO2, putative [Talaromyces stipitatus ATCC 10500]
MSRPFPYTFISCPCAQQTRSSKLSKRNSREFSPKKQSSPRKPAANTQQPEDPDLENDESDEESEQTFNPRSARANFSLYPPEQLLYCEDCHQIKCPRCITEETVCWYCPNCLFETPSSMVRSEGNRCARNCFNCPVCTAPLSVTTLENTIENSAQQGPWILSCGYCMWTTLDIGIKFSKPTNIRSQLSKMYEEKGHGGSVLTGDTKSSLSMGGNLEELESPTTAEAEDKEEPLAQVQHDHTELDTNARFAALKRFYTKQIEDASVSATDPLASDFGAAFSSPSALSRIMSIYTSSSHLYGGGAKKAKSKPPVMREALTPAEGIKVTTGAKERTVINRMASDDCTWDDILSKEQRAFQDPEARFMEELRPLPVLLRTKRSKRCKSCKHILVKPEFKPASTRFRIRLIALSYIPLPTIRPLMPAALPGQSVSATSLLQPNLDSLTPLRPIQYLLTLKNHMFDPVNVTLATPSITPGRIGSKVTILCPQFDLGANSDVWDEALQAGPAAPTSSSIATLTSSAGRAGTIAGSERVAEAGKVWEKGRNWTTIVIEVVPEVLPGTEQPGVQGNAGKKKDPENEGDDEDDIQLREDEDVLEIPIFVHLEWDSENQMDQDDGAGGDKSSLRERGGGSDAQNPDSIKRELAYWMVLGVGRISPKLF